MHPFRYSAAAVTSEISIAMATCNGARFLGEQLDSLCRQTLLPRELVVHDDCSDDGTLEAIAAFAARAPFPVKVLRNEARIGYRQNFMQAAEDCQYPLIAFCDQDDVWLPRKLANLAALFADRNVLLAYHDAQVATTRLQPICGMQDRAAPRSFNPPLTLKPWRYGLGFTQMLRRELLQHHDLWLRSVDFFAADQREAHDQWFSFLSSSLGVTGYIAEPLVLYRRHGGNTSDWLRPAKGFVNLLGNFRSEKTSRMSAYRASAQQRAEALEAIRTRTQDESLRARADRAAAMWRRMEANHRLRLKIRDGGNMKARMSSLLDAFKRGAYRPRKQGGMGFKACLRDIRRGVLLRPRD